MASTFKVPLAVQLMRRVDAGEISLDQLHEMRPSDYHPGSGKLTPKMNYPGVVLSLRMLMELMLQISDNSATDILLEYAGCGWSLYTHLKRQSFGVIFGLMTSGTGRGGEAVTANLRYPSNMCNYLT